MAFLVAYTAIDTTNLLDPYSYFNAKVDDITTQHEYRTHTFEISLDVVGTGLNTANARIINSLTLYFGVNITGVTSEQTAAWQITGLSMPFFSNALTPYQFGAAVLAGNDTIIGSNGIGDLLQGYNGNDVIFARGGTDDIDGGRGRDRLSGGAANDTFYFDNGLITANVDTITDFVHAHDRIGLDKAIFAKLNVSPTLNPAFFHVGPAAADANDYLVYNRTTGQLFYDRDGAGPAHQVLFAIVANHALLSSHDLFCFTA